MRRAFFFAQRFFFSYWNAFQGYLSFQKENISKNPAFAGVPLSALPLILCFAPRKFSTR